MNKTAMQQYIAVLQKHAADNPMDRSAMQRAIVEARKFYATERQQIEDAFNEAQHSTMITSEDYFTTTYKTS